MVGLISSLREIITKKGTRMAFAQLEDLSGTLELVIFPDVFASCEMQLKGEGSILVTGNLEREEDSCKILVEKIESTDQLFRRAKKMILSMDEEMQRELPRLKEVFEKHPGETGLQFKFKLPQVDKVVHLELTDPHGVTPSRDFFEGLQQIFGDTNFVELQ